MRWPLRYQILLPMIGATLCAVAGVSLLNAWLSARRAREQVEQGLDRIAQTLTRSNFPLTDAVLEQIQGLSGAECVLTDPAGRVLASSAPRGAFADLPPPPDVPRGAAADRGPLAEPLALGAGRYFHTPLVLERPGPGQSRATLHILYPEERYQQAWRDVVYPPLLVGAVATLLVAAFGLGIAGRITRPLERLQRQVGEIAEGRFEALPVPAGRDEVADLSRSVNRLAERLARYESEVRRHERLRTLGQLGGGIAHQIRNAVTGCRLAVELHARDCPRAGDEGLAVAERQLTLMERYLQRFLALGRTEPRPHAPLDLGPVIDNVVSLVRPTARHVGVELEWAPPAAPVLVSGDADALEQLLVNLVLNGVEAAAPPGAGAEPACVSVGLERGAGRVTVIVADTGPGPAAAVAERLFEPFVSGKPDGAGLGLAVARETAREHGGDVRWERSGGRTRFVVELPGGAA